MSALEEQVGGNHYKTCAIQPVEYSHKNGLGFLQGDIVKRITRFNREGGKGLQDLLKARHEIDLLLELEYPDDDEAGICFAEINNDRLLGCIKEAFMTLPPGPAKTAYLEFIADVEGVPLEPEQMFEAMASKAATPSLIPVLAQIVSSVCHSVRTSKAHPAASITDFDLERQIHERLRCP